MRNSWHHGAIVKAMARVKQLSDAWHSCQLGEVWLQGWSDVQHVRLDPILGDVAHANLRAMPVRLGNSCLFPFGHFLNLSIAQHLINLPHKEGLLIQHVVQALARAQSINLANPTKALLSLLSLLVDCVASAPADFGAARLARPILNRQSTAMDMCKLLPIGACPEIKMATTNMTMLIGGVAQVECCTSKASLC